MADWKLDDPAGQGVEAVRQIWDEIERRIRGLLADLGIEAAGRPQRRRVCASAHLTDAA